MSEPSPETENSQLPEPNNRSPATANAKLVDVAEPMAEYPGETCVENAKGDQLAAALPVNGIDEPRRTSKKLDMPSLELSDNEFNSTDSDSFAGRTQKNRSLELKLSAIIEKACSSDFEVEDPPAAEPPTSAAKPPTESPTSATESPTSATSNVTVTLPNNQLLFTVAGVNVSAAIADHSASQQLPAESAKNASARRKKYVYKLKSKAGAVLTYTSYTPVVLKKPRINLTRVEVAATPAKRKVPPSSSLVNGKRGKGRPIRTPSAAPSATPSAPADNAADATAVTSNGATSSFGMQTRKRKLHFGPDGRLMCVAKRRRSSSSSSSSSMSDDKDSRMRKESTDEDWEATGDDLRRLNSPDVSRARSAKRRPAAKSQQIPKSQQTPKLTKVAKLEKPETPHASKLLETPKLAKVTADGAAKTSVTGGHTVLAAKTSVTGGPLVSAAKASVNPAQLLSTLLGVTIRPNQLNTVRFKPKSFQKQPASFQKTIVLSNDELKAVGTNLAGSTALKATAPKPLMQKILPKSSLTSIFNKTATTNASPSPPSRLLKALSKDLVPAEVAPALAEPSLEVPNFDNFTDSRTVRTKGGPKKFLLQSGLELDEDEKLNRLTVYDLAQNVFDRMPTWNLHIMPDTNTFCIAQVGRGRMGIPILKKSVELNDNFAAKIFVHQLHCKKFDGVYDTEAKINSLIAEINSLAA